MKTLDGLRHTPSWITHMGCLSGCIHYLNLPITDSWLYGATGHAFVINISRDSCPSGPTAWKTMEFFRLGKNAGYTIDGVFAHKSMPDFKEKQRQAYDHVKQAIDAGHPCYGWELEVPEFYNIHGYDDQGYHYKGPGSPDGKGPKPWQELGDTGIGVVEVYSVAPGTPASPEVTLWESLQFALEHAQGPDKWIFPNYTSGPAAYDTWTAGIEDASASRDGIAYNAQCWHECRGHAAAFLEEAKAVLPNLTPQLETARAHYASVAEGLRELTEIYPFNLPPDYDKLIEEDARQQLAIDALQNSKEAEEAGLDALLGILDEL